MKKNTLAYLFILFISFLTTSCGNKGGFLIPTSSGRAYELLVVIDQGVWQRPSGRALFNVLDTDVSGLPNPERSFKIMYTSPNNYDSTLKLIRNIIVVDIQDIYSQPKMKYSENVYSAPQIIMKIQAPDEKSFQEYVTKNKQTILDFFTRAEMNRQIKNLKDKHNEYISSKVSELFDCDIWLPVELGAYKEGKDFFWAGTNRATADMNFVMYSYPFTDINTFSRDYFMHKRDSVMKVNIPGSKEGMYMRTDTITVSAKGLKLKDNYIMEAKGLWNVKGDFMGGPFVSHVRVDKDKKRVYVSEIFVYSPEKKKRNIVRMMQASLYTLKLPEEKQKTAIPTDVQEEKSNNKD